MYNFDELIYGFKKKIQVQLTFDNLSQKKFIIIVLIGVVLLVIVAGSILYKSWQTKTSPPTQKLTEQPPKPTQAAPQNNPFEVRTNPFKDIKTNPFR